MDGVREGLEIVEDAIGRAAGGEVVVAGVEDDHARFVFEDDAVGEVVDVGDRRAAEAAVDDGEVGEGVGRLPEADGGAADEEDRIRGRGVFVVVGFEGGDFFRSARWLGASVVRCSAMATKRHKEARKGRWGGCACRRWRRGGSFRTNVGIFE